MSELVKQETQIMTSTGQIAGMEGIDNEMLIIPRIKLLQALSAEVEEFDLKAGSFVNSVTKEVMAEKGGSVKIIPLMVKKSRIYFQDMEEGGGILCMAQDGMNGRGEPGGVCANCPLKDWGDDKPACTMFIDFAVLPVSDKGELIEELPLIVNFGNTGFKTGKTFATMVRAKNQNPWNFTYELKAKYVDSDKGKYYVPQVLPAGKTSPEILEQLAGLYEMMASISYEVHQDDAPQAEAKPQTEDEVGF